jgi:hypothetical protein
MHDFDGLCGVVLCKPPEEGQLLCFLIYMKIPSGSLTGPIPVPSESSLALQRLAHEMGQNLNTHRV